MKKEVFYVKSLEEDFISKTLRAKKKVDFQSIEDIIKTKKINPNTKSFGKKKDAFPGARGEVNPYTWLVFILHLNFIDKVNNG